MKNVQTQIEKALESIEHIEQATVPAFFETRLKAKMQKLLVETNDNWFAVKKPIWAVAFLLVFLCINVFMLSYSNSKSLVVEQQQPTTIEAFANDYLLLNNSSQY